jgi:SAM-dependent methyltransferase
MKFSKVIDIEDFASEELIPYLRAIAEEEKEIFGIEKPIIIPDSKNWETAMALYSFDQNHLLKQGKVFAGIGAGTERLTEFLANQGSIVFPVDRYLESTPWSDVAPGGYMVSASNYCYKHTNIQNIIPVHSDARVLNLPSNFFDGIYSSGSIEHFGSLNAVEAAASEIARILKPGGIASISTEFRLDGPDQMPWFDDNCILFTPELIKKHIVQASGLTPIGIPENRPSAKTFGTRKILVDFLSSAKNVKTLQDKLDAYPNLVLFHDGFLFCSVHILLQKPLDWELTLRSKSMVQSFRKEVHDNSRAAIEELRKMSVSRATLAPGAERVTIKPHRVSALLSKINTRLQKTPKLRRSLRRTLRLFPGLTPFLRRKIKSHLPSRLTSKIF